LWLEVWGRKLKSSWAFNYAETPGTPITAKRLAPVNQTMEELSLQMGLQSGTEYTVGYTELRGAGHLTVLGLTPSPELFVALYDHLNASIPSRSLTPQVSTALFRRGTDFFLFAVNSGEEATIAEVSLTSDFSSTPCWRARNLVSDQEWTVDLRERGRVTFPIGRKDGAILHLQGVSP
jgi:hypothetical protein